MRISDWSSDVCSSDLEIVAIGGVLAPDGNGGRQPEVESMRVGQVEAKARARAVEGPAGTARAADRRHPPVVSEQFELHHFTPRAPAERRRLVAKRSEEHTSELQSLMRSSYAVFCLKKKKANTDQHSTPNDN